MRILTSRYGNIILGHERFDNSKIEGFENMNGQMELKASRDELESYKEEGLRLSRRLGLFEERSRLLKAELQVGIN